MLVHAVNPWGFAWLRRVNEDNVDLNRNFLDHAAPHPENPDVRRPLRPREPRAARRAETPTLPPRRAAPLSQSERGSAAVYRALSGGQYRHPRGVQFGGRTPVWSNRALRERLGAARGTAPSSP